MKQLTIYAENHQAPAICGPCGGKCCRGYPGIASPSDFGAPSLKVRILYARKDNVVFWLAGTRFLDSLANMQWAGFFDRCLEVWCFDVALDSDDWMLCAFSKRK